MDLGLTQKVVVLTGGAGLKGSIGQTMAKALMEEGAILAILDRNERGYEYQEDMQKNGIDGLFVKVDLTEPIQVQEAIAKVVDKYGRIDVMINNVGVNDGAGLDSSYEDFMNSLKLNLASYYLTVKYALPHLKKSKGNILNVGSKVAYTGQGGTSGYAAAKGGILALTREWAVDLASLDIRVNCLVIAECWTPAYDQWIQTQSDPDKKLETINNKIPLGNRMTTAEELANQVLFTVSDRSSHTTGQHIFVDGGYTHLDRAISPNK